MILYLRWSNLFHKKKKNSQRKRTRRKIHLIFVEINLLLLIIWFLFWIITAYLWRQDCVLSISHFLVTSTDIHSRHAIRQWIIRITTIPIFRFLMDMIRWWKWWLCWRRWWWRRWNIHGNYDISFFRYFNEKSKNMNLMKEV